MIIRLGDGIAETQAGETFPVGSQNAFIGHRGVGCQPGEQGGTDIKVQIFEIIYNIQNAELVVPNSGAGIGRITFPGNPGIPVGKGIGTLFQFNLFDPGIFPGGLIKMAMHDDKNLTGRDQVQWHRIFLKNKFGQVLPGMDNRKGMRPAIPRLVIEQWLNAVTGQVKTGLQPVFHKIRNIMVLEVL